MTIAYNMNMNLMFLLSFILFFLDRITKIFILRHPSLFTSRFLALQFSPNHSLFFFPLNQNFLIIVSAVILLLLLVYLIKLPQKHHFFFFGLSLIFLGGFSNFLDRIIYGYVIDWFSFFPASPAGKTGGLSPPFFNLADAMIALGLFLISIKLFRLFLEKSTGPKSN